MSESLRPEWFLKAAMELTAEQVGIAAHALGWRDGKGHIRWTNPYRNFYECEEDARWEDLVAKKLARRSPPSELLPLGAYHVTELGRSVVHLRMAADHEARRKDGKEAERGNTVR